MRIDMTGNNDGEWIIKGIIWFIVIVFCFSIGVFVGMTVILSDAVDFVGEECSQSSRSIESKKTRLFRQSKNTQ